MRAINSDLMPELWLTRMKDDHFARANVEWRGSVAARLDGKGRGRGSHDNGFGMRE